MKSNILLVVALIVLSGAILLLGSVKSVPGAGFHIENIFSVKRNVSLELTFDQVPKSKYYVYNSNITIYPSGTYEIDIGNIISAETPITFIGFKGMIEFNNSFDIVGKFSEIKGVGFTVKNGNVRGIYNLTYDRIEINGLKTTMSFNNTEGTLKTDDIEIQTNGKYVVLRSFLGDVVVSNTTRIYGRCSKIIVKRRNEIVIS